MLSIFSCHEYNIALYPETKDRKKSLTIVKLHKCNSSKILDTTPVCVVMAPIKEEKGHFNLVINRSLNETVKKEAGII